MTEKLRVLHLLSDVSYSGSGANLAPFFTFANSTFFDMAAGAIHEFDPRRARMLREGGTQVEAFHGDLGRLSEFLKRESIDILHFTRAGDENSHIIRAALDAEVPVIVELNVFGLHDPSPEARSIDRHLLQSKTTALRYIKRAGLQMDAFLARGLVQYLPVDFVKFDRIASSHDVPQRVRERLELEADAPLVCRIGRPDLWKWSFFTLHAFSLLVEKFPRARFVVVGGIPPAAASKIKRWGLEKHLRILSDVADETVIEVLHAADVVAHSSHIGESFGAAIAQAMAAKRPVVVNSTDWADNAQIELVDDRITGIVANTPRAFADSMLYLLTNRPAAKLMGEMGYRKARSEYSADVVTLSLEKSYSELADAKGVRPDRERSMFYRPVGYIPTRDHVRRWPAEYSRRLRASGSGGSAIGRSVLGTTWMLANAVPALRGLPIPRSLLRRDDRIAYLAAVT